MKRFPLAVLAFAWCAGAVVFVSWCSGPLERGNMGAWQAAMAITFGSVAFVVVFLTPEDK